MKHMHISSGSFFFGIISIVFLASCASHDLDKTCVETVSYVGTVRPIVMLKCAIDGCHNGDNGTDRDWRDYEKFKAHSATVKSYINDRIMPPASSPAGELTAAEIQTISCWVDQGAPNN